MRTHVLTTRFWLSDFLTKATYKSESWNLATGERIGVIDEAGATWRIQKSLSPDGSRIAFWNNERKLIDIWSYKTGQRVCQVELGRFAQFLLASPDRLLVSVSERSQKPTSYQLLLFDANTGELLKENPPVTELSKVLFLSSAKVSSNGKYVASYSSDRGFRIFETNTIEQIAEVPVMVVPKSSGECAFSHDGTKLAGYSSSAERTRIFVVSLTDGNVEQFSFEKPVGHFAGRDSSYVQRIEWLPDDSGWLIGGDRIVDAKLRKTIWKFEFDSSRHNRSVIVPGALVRRGSNYDSEAKTGGDLLQKLEWPVDRVESIVRTLNAESGTKLKPSDTASVTVEISTLRSGNTETIQEQLSAALYSRLTAIGLNLAPAGQADVILSAVYSEAPGRLMRKNGRYLSQVMPGVTSGLQSVAATLDLTLSSRQSQEEIWSYRLVEDPVVLNVRGKTNIQSIRNAVFQSLLKTIKTSPIPYVVTDGGVLPGTTVE